MSNIIRVSWDNAVHPEQRLDKQTSAPEQSPDPDEAIRDLICELTSLRGEDGRGRMSRKLIRGENVYDRPRRRKTTFCFLASKKASFAGK